MLALLSLLLALAAGPIGPPSGPPEAPADLVNPLLGTYSTFQLSKGNTYPSVQMPFGMAAWTPQTDDGSWTYTYQSDRLQGIRLTHQPSPWISDYGRFTVMPVVGDLVLDPVGRASKFNHYHEQAHPYHYSVRLDRYDVTAEVAPALRSGMMRFTFPASDAAHLVFDVAPKGAMVRFDAATRTLRGFTRSNSGGTHPNFALYFVAVFDKPFTAHGAWVDSTDLAAPAVAEGNHVRAWLRFRTRAGEQVNVRIGTSFISLEQAERNLKADVGTRSFDAVRDAARKTWNDELRRIRIEGATEEQQVTFYTAFYRALLFPHLWHEVDAAGRLQHFSPYTGKVHPGEFYTDNGFWDTFRAVFPLFTWLYPERDAEIIRGLLNHYREGGRLPKWMSPGERNVMIGTHTASVIADAWAKGIRDFDAQTALEAMIKDATVADPERRSGRIGIDAYQRLGYVPADSVGEATARTLEFAYNDFTLARFAADLGRADEARRYLDRSFYYEHVWDGGTGFMRGRLSNGAWVEPFDPVEWGGAFTEGSSWHYSWSVMHDVRGLINLHGGKAPFTRRLDALFTTPAEFKVGSYRTVIHEMAEMVLGYMGQYAHGNQPVHHVVYLYNYAGQPWKTQYWAREVMNRLYGPGPDGLIGDEDNGQMSAWYLFSALGFYPVSPGEPAYVLGAPLFPRVTVDLPGGKTLVIEAPGNSNRNRFVQSVTLNGAPHAKNWLSHADLAAGGTLRFEMGAEPNRSWGSRDEDAPPSVTKTWAAAMPFLTTPAGPFRGQTQVAMATVTEGAVIHYTLDGAEPTPASPRYTGPFALDRAARLKARAFHPTLAPSAVLEAPFTPQP